ncbi:polyphosphate kinase [Clostridium sp. SY8519]|uniref:polyphosphate kinase 1 n=1 Tax=Clostridium sp. (strain SY8519) TaxID=1042156 RepID=UPI0002171FED|nr:polyphosphate kinase 1 [Clostridium sp. SY8519]BAK47876.1 polyphosphate kinase [Clostridium sp. SY8519]
MSDKEQTLEKKEKSTPCYMQNRELSWLKFNDRVLSEAQDETVPPLERLRFVTIFTTNLDEFIMVRAGSLIDQWRADPTHRDNKSGMTAREQLEAIFRELRPLYEKRDRLYYELEYILRSYGVSRLSYAELNADEQQYLETYFHESILPALAPLVIDTHHPFPYLPNKMIYIAMTLRTENEKRIFGFLPVPQVLPEVIWLPGREIRYIALEDVLLEYADVAFPTYAVEEKVQMCITRNADIHAEDEDLEVENDFRQVMKKMLRDRKHLEPVRLELSHAIGTKFMKFLQKKLGLEEGQIFFTKAPIRLNYAYPLGDRLSEAQKKVLLYPPFAPQMPETVRSDQTMLEQISRRDLLLSYPYESMEPFLRMVDEAADDPDVLSIQITIYRLAGTSRLAESLVRAAENGKEVTALIELRARFDEQSNINWSRHLEKAGCTLIYGIQNYKVHSKVCLITRREGKGIFYLTQIGTGNYNEKTAKMYTDLSLMMADQQIGRDARIFFQNMRIGNICGQYHDLLVAPVSLKKTVLEEMDREIARGRDGRMFFKMNALTDREIIQKLKEASCAGVQIRMLIRGICCLVPGIPETTEGIEVRSIVGRYLEHSRIYLFGTQETERMYIASADFMTRNTERRVEVAVPVRSKDCRNKIHGIIEMFWKDTRKARRLRSDGTYEKISGAPYDSQAEQMNLALEHRAKEPDKKIHQIHGASQEGSRHAAERKGIRYLIAHSRWMKKKQRKIKTEDS